MAEYTQRQKWSGIIGIVSFWSLITAITSAQIYDLPIMRQYEIPLWLIVVRQSMLWLLWIPFTMVVLLLAQRFPLYAKLKESHVRNRPLERPLDRPIWQILCIHGAVCVAIYIVHALVIGLLRRYIVNIDELLWPQRLLRIGRTILWAIDSLLYCAVALGYSLIGFYQRLRQRDLQTAHLETELVRSQLNALTMQLQPHFLFNALNSIATLVREARNPEAVKALAQLAALLRATLDDVRDEYGTLWDELEFLKRYIAIEQIRFQDRLRVEFVIAPEAETALLPTLLLQPLVENAVLHGIGGRIGAGLLRIEAKRQGGELVVMVEDDGAGMPEGWTAEYGAGVGLRNVRARLRLLYAEAGRLEFTPRIGGGTIARISIPF